MTKLMESKVTIHNLASQADLCYNGGIKIVAPAVLETPRGWIRSLEERIMNTLPHVVQNDNVLMKRCIGPCKKILPATTDFFYKYKRSKDGLRNECRICQNEKARQRHSKNVAKNKLNPSVRNVDPCPVCGEDNPEKFYFRATGRISRALCRSCLSAADHDQRQKSRLKTRFGLTIAEYEGMFEAQGGVCAICKQPEIAMDNTGKRTRALAVDHNHKTGKIRQLLCGTCNYLLGYVKDNADLLQSASEYLKKHEGDEANGEATCSKVYYRSITGRARD